MRDAYHLYLNGEEYSRMIEFLIEMKNRMLIEGKYTDGVDDVLCKFLKAKKKKIKIEYV